MKDFQFAGKSFLVEAGAKKSFVVPADEVAFMDKKFVAVSGTALSNIGVFVGLGKTNLNLTLHSKYVSSSGNTHIIEIPMPTNNLTITIDNSSGSLDVNVMYYGGSA